MWMHKLIGLQILLNDTITLAKGCLESNHQISCCLSTQLRIVSPKYTPHSFSACWALKVLHSMYNICWFSYSLIHLTTNQCKVFGRTLTFLAYEFTSYLNEEKPSVQFGNQGDLVLRTVREHTCSSEGYAICTFHSVTTVHIINEWVYLQIHQSTPASDQVILRATYSFIEGFTRFTRPNLQMIS